MHQDPQHDPVSHDALFESLSLFISTLHHDVAASLRHSNGFATLLQEEAESDHSAVEKWTEQIASASSKGQAVLSTLTECLRRAMAQNHPERIEKLEEVIRGLPLSATLHFDVSDDPFTDPVKLEDIYLSLDESLRLVSSDPTSSRIETFRTTQGGHLQIIGLTPSTAIRASNVDRFFTPMKFDQADRTETKAPVIFKIKLTAASLRGDATASITPEGLLRIEVTLPDLL